MQAIGALKALLDMPMEVFFHAYPEKLQEVNMLLNYARIPWEKSFVSAFGGKREIATYGDLICAVWNLRELATVDGWRDEDTYDTCADILWHLAEVLSAPQGSGGSDVQEYRMQSLQEKLAVMRNENERFPVLAVPLTHYCYAGACLSASEFPLYIYNMGLSQYMQLYGYPNCDLRGALRCIRRMRASDDEIEVADASMLLFDLLVDAVSAAVL